MEGREEKLSTMLMSMGILPSMAGFKYEKKAVEVYEKHKGRMTRVYEEVGKEYKVSGAAVEKDMRGAIEMASRRGWLMRLNEITGIEYLKEGEKLTVKEFIATLVEIMNFSDDNVVLKRY